MKNTRKYLLLGISAAVLLTGCGNSSNSKSDSSAKDNSNTAATDSTEEAVFTEADGAGDSTLSNAAAPGEEESTDESEDAPLAPITPSDYLVKNASDYVTLGSYDGLEIIQYTYEVTDDMVQDRIEEELANVGEEESVTTPSAEGDTVYVTLKSSIQGSSEAPDEEETYFTIGDEEFGPDFDAALTGLSAGDTKQFSSTFDDTVWNEDWIGQTVDFDIKVSDVTTMKVPAYDDAYLAEYTDYSTKEDYEKSIREALEMENEEMSYSDAIEALFNAAIDATTFNGYPDELYNEEREQMLSFYRMFAGDEELSDAEILEAFGVSEEDISSEILASVNQKLFISAYCQENDINVTEEEYVAFLTENASYYGASSASQFEELYTRDSLVWDLYDSKVADELYSAAHITEAAYEEEALFEEDLEAETIEEEASEEDTAAETES